MTSPEVPTPGLIIRDENDQYYWDNAIGASSSSSASYIISVWAGIYRLHLSVYGAIPEKTEFELLKKIVGYSSYDRLQDVSEIFVTSDDFINIADANEDGGISNDELLTHMYETAFGREADQPGYDWWLNELETGNKSKGNVLLEMTQSNEYVLLTEMIVSEYAFSDHNHIEITAVSAMDVDMFAG